jgi:hypothetical protein
MANSYDCDEDKDDEWSMQATRGSDGEEEKKKHVVSLRKKSDQLDRKEPPCRGHPSLERFEEFQKLDEERRVFLRKYVAENPNDFCVKCGLNVKFTDFLFATYEYEALVFCKPNCDICGSREGRICDAYQHQDYHEENCLKI